jgi:hypothetical protein
MPTGSTGSGSWISAGRSEWSAKGADCRWERHSYSSRKFAIDVGPGKIRQKAPLEGRRLQRLGGADGLWTRLRKECDQGARLSANDIDVTERKRRAERLGRAAGPQMRRAHQLAAVISLSAAAISSIPAE